MQTTSTSQVVAIVPGNTIWRSCAQRDRYISGAMPQLKPRQHLISLMVARIGWKELAARLEVPLAILHDWFNGETQMPDAKLLALMRLLDEAEE